MSYERPTIGGHQLPPDDSAKPRCCPEYRVCLRGRTRCIIRLTAASAIQMPAESLGNSLLRLNDTGVLNQTGIGQGLIFQRYVLSFMLAAVD